jgi:xanthine dehydrogenase large subunit
MAWTGKRHPFKNDFRVGFDHEGRILALEANLYSDGGAYLDLSAPVLQRAMLHCDNAYFLPHVRLEGRICRSNFPPNTAFRGFGGPQGVALIENIMEDIAYHRQLDPLVVRERNLYGAAPRHITPYGQELSNNTLPELFQTIKKKAEYEARRAAIQSFNQKNCGKLKGLAITPVKFGISFTVKHLNQGNALINLHRDGTFQVSTGATEMGQGVNIKIAQIVASVFDLSPRQIKIMPTSTEKNHNTSATAASSGTDINGAAALIAAEKLKKRLAAFASFYLAATEDVQFKIQSLAEEFNQEAHESRDDVSFAKGQVYLSSDPTKVMSFAALAELAYFQRISLGEYGYYRTKGIEYDRVKGRGKPFLYFTNGVAASEVEIDEYTGELKVRRTDIVMDLGRPINDGIDRGQIAGAFVQGLGWVSSEELCYRPDGSLVTHSPTTYKIPNIQDIPREFHIELMENLDHNSSVRGSKAVGEPPFLLAISVWVAVKQALQARLQQEVRDLCLPATNEEILRVLNRRADHGTDRPIL